MGEVIRVDLRRSRVPEDVMNRIRRRMYLYDASDLADIAGVSARTIYAVRSGRSKWPRGTTLFPILEAIGFDLVLIDSRTGREVN